MAEAAHPSPATIANNLVSHLRVFIGTPGLMRDAPEAAAMPEKIAGPAAALRQFVVCAACIDPAAPTEVHREAGCTTLNENIDLAGFIARAGRKCHPLTATQSSADNIARLIALQSR